MNDDERTKAAKKIISEAFRALDTPKVTQTLHVHLEHKDDWLVVILDNGECWNRRLKLSAGSYPDHLKIGPWEKIDLPPPCNPKEEP